MWRNSVAERRFRAEGAPRESKSGENKNTMIAAVLVFSALTFSRHWRLLGRQ
jgi:hypothetical protein